MDLRQPVSGGDVNHLLVKFSPLLVGDGPSRWIEYAVGLSPHCLELWTLVLDLNDRDPLVLIQFYTSGHLRREQWGGGGERERVRDENLGY